MLKVQKKAKPKSIMELVDENIKKNLEMIEKENEEELDEMDENDIKRFVKKHKLAKDGNDEEQTEELFSDN